MSFGVPGRYNNFGHLLGLPGSDEDPGPIHQSYPTADGFVSVREVN
jgi:hypothetical protein